MDKNIYLDILIKVEKIYRVFLDSIREELDKMGAQDLTSTQAMILYNIGDGQISVGDLTNRGYYLGSNASYNLKKMINNAYLNQERSIHDARSTLIFLSEKGKIIYDNLSLHFSKQLNAVSQTMNVQELGQLDHKLNQLDLFLKNALYREWR